MSDTGFARLAAALDNRVDEQPRARCRWPLARCDYPAVLGGYCGLHRGMELHNRERAMAARANATTKPRGTA